MAFKYTDSVVLVQKSRDGTIRRVNAIVLGSQVQDAKPARSKPLMDGNRNVLPAGEYLDLAYPDPGLVQDGQAMSTRHVEQVFRLAYTVPAWKDGAWIGWQPGSTTEVAPTPPPAAAPVPAKPAEKK